MNKYPLFLYIVVAIFSCCSSEKSLENSNQAIIRIKKFPVTVNYLTSSSLQSVIIQKNVFTTLYRKNDEGIILPFLAQEKPVTVMKNAKSILKITLNDEAHWSNGEKIRVNDVIFSLKVFKLPIAINVSTRVYLDRISRIEIKNDTLYAYVSGLENEATLLVGDFNILQKSKYDSLDLLGHITFDDINNNPEKVAADEKVKQFVDEFLKDNFKFKGKYFGGSGAYVISGMQDGNFIKLIKNPNWWGLQFAGKLPQFSANPDEIIYQYIKEPIVAVQALKAKSIDVMDDIPANEFVQLIEDESFLENYNLFTPLKYKFTYIGFNSRIKYLSNIKLRNALAYLLKPQDMIKVVEQGYGVETVGPINPVNEYYYNNSISTREYNLQKAQDIFLDNGFELIDGKLLDTHTKKALEFTISYRQDTGYESIAFLFKEEAKKIGIKLKVKQYEGRTASKIARSHQFEIFVGAFNGDPFSLNFSGLFSQEAAKVNGMNFTGFGSDMTDSLIQAANYALDSTSKKKALFAMQEELHNEATMLFLYFSQNKIAIHKRFENLKISSTKPGYDVSSFTLRAKAP